MSPVIQRLKKRQDFLQAAATQNKWVQPSLILQIRPFSSFHFQNFSDETLRIGFTASKRVGNAVQRNRAKRRLRVAADIALKEYGLPKHDYVFIARPETVQAEWSQLLSDARIAVSRLLKKINKTQNKD